MKFVGRLRRKKEIRGMAIVVVLLGVGLAMSLALVFLNQALQSTSIAGIQSDAVTAELQMESTYEEARGKIERAMANFQLDGSFALHPNSLSSSESLEDINDNYATSPATALTFLQHAVESISMLPDGTLEPGHEYESFNAAFPSVWTDPDESDDEFVEYRFEISALQPVAELSGAEPNITFEYFYLLQVRSYGRDFYTQSASEEKGSIEINLTRAPFSQFALMRSQNQNQDGNSLVFAGGDTTAQAQEVFGGPVHMNQTPWFYGAPVFMDTFTSAVQKSNWDQSSVSGYSGTAVFNGPSLGSVDSIDLPTEVHNVVRLAAGDTDPEAYKNNSEVDESELVTFLKENASGTMGTVSTIPEGIYIPVDNQVSKNPTGGIFVRGEVDVRLDVEQGASEIPSDYFANLPLAAQSCKFQKISIDHDTGSVTDYDIYIADDPCDATYVFNSDSPSTPPISLAGRINGNIHVDGKIDRLGGESRTNASIATDFGFTISAKKDVRIDNDIMYEDAEFVEIQSDGTMGSTVVANPDGEVGGSGFQPTAENVAPQISSASQTVLGIISTHRNVLLRDNSPANLNLHASILAGNSSAYSSSTGLGCGQNTSSKRGCGFGNEGWDSRVGLGSLKLLGGVSEYKSQSMGRLTSPPKGYQRRFMYDVRFLDSLTPPAFPLSNDVQATSVVKPFKAWRLVKADDPN